jgi:phosphoribosylglycinamide formyltransferase-1
VTAALTRIRVGGLAAVAAAAASFAVVLVPTLLAWAGAGSVRGSGTAVFRAATVLWLLGHRTSVEVPDGRVALVPLGLTLVSLTCCGLAAHRMTRRLDRGRGAPGQGPGDRPTGTSAGRRPDLVPTVTFVVSYGLLTTGAAVVAAGTALHPVAWQALLGGVVVSGGAGLLGATAHSAGGVSAALSRVPDVLRLPPLVRGWLAPALVAVNSLLVWSGLLLGVALATSHRQVGLLHAGLAPGPLGGVALIALEISLVPNAVLWAGAFAAGPGFSVGAGDRISLLASDPGTLPVLPLLGALPEPGPLPGWVWAVLVGPVVAGAVAGSLLVRRMAPAPFSTRLGNAAGTAATAGVLVLPLLWLAGGAAGPGRLAVVGSARSRSSRWLRRWAGRCRPGDRSGDGHRISSASVSEAPSGPQGLLPPGEPGRQRRVVVLVSGTGTLLQALLDAAGPHTGYSVVGVLSDRADALGLERARTAGVPTAVVALADFPDRATWDEAVARAVGVFAPDIVVLAGFMRILGEPFLDRYADRTINTHPALLPAFPGAHGVRDALDYGVKVTGSTVILIDAGTDSGPVVAQRPVEVLDGDDEETLHERIKIVERELLVEVVGRMARQGWTVTGRRATFGGAAGATGPDPSGTNREVPVR